jgi:hypothetical protein
MKDAMAAVNAGTGLNAAAGQFAVPKATLKRHLSGSNKTVAGGKKNWDEALICLMN